MPNLSSIIGWGSIVLLLLFVVVILWRAHLQPRCYYCKNHVNRHDHYSVLVKGKSKVICRICAIRVAGSRLKASEDSEFR